MEKFTAIEIPFKSKDHYITDSGFIRYDIGKGTMGWITKCVDEKLVSIKLNKEYHEIIGYTQIESTKYILIKHNNK